MIDTEARYLSPPQAATIVSCSAEKLIAAIRRGELRAVDISDRPGVGKPRFRIDRDDLDAWLRSREVVPRPKAPRRPKQQKPEGWVEYFK